MKRTLSILVIFLITLGLQSCSFIKGVFEAGVWSGIVLVILVILAIIWLIAKFSGNRRQD